MYLVFFTGVYVREEHMVPRKAGGGRGIVLWCGVGGERGLWSVWGAVK